MDDVWPTFSHLKEGDPIPDNCVIVKTGISAHVYLKKQCLDEESLAILDKIMEEE